MLGLASATLTPATAASVNVAGDSARRAMATVLRVALLYPESRRQGVAVHTQGF